jgi:uncharacterized FlaG/YvyC family protein
MTPAAVSGLAQSLPLFSSVGADSSPREDIPTQPSATNTAGSREGKAVVVDTVSLSGQSLQSEAAAKKTPLAEEQKKENPVKDATSEKSNKATANVQFVYDVKGQLLVRYMDSANRLIYQVPSELMLRLRETAAKKDSSVNTSV